MSPVKSELVPFEWVDDDATLVFSAQAAHELGEGFVAPTAWRVNPTGITSFACDESVRPWSLDAFIQSGNRPGLVYRTPTQPDELTQYRDSCDYYTTVSEETTRFSPGIWLGTPLSEVLVRAGGQTEEGLREYLVEWFRTASSDRLQEVASVLLELGKSTPHFAASPTAGSPLEAVEALRNLLSLTWQEVESATGIDENTFHYWRRAKAKPRPSTVRKLMSVYGLVYALVRSKGESDTVAWFATGSPRRLELLISGQIDRLQAETVEYLSESDERQPIYHAYRPEEEYDEPVAQSTARPRLASQRAPRRRRSEGI